MPRPGLPVPCSQSWTPLDPVPATAPALTCYDLREREEGRAGRGRPEGARAGWGPWPRRERSAHQRRLLDSSKARDRRGGGKSRSNFSSGWRAARRSPEESPKPPGDSWLSELCALRRELCALSRGRYLTARSAVQPGKRAARRGEGPWRPGRREERLSEGRTDGPICPGSREHWLSAPRRGPQLEHSARNYHQFYCLLHYIEKYENLH